MNNQTVSVVMPARNAAATIGAAVRSVLDSPRVTELIVIDDASSDGTADRALGVGDPRIRVISGPGSGISAALNRGFAEARGEFVCRCDADDAYPADRLDWQLEILAGRPDLVAVSGAFRTTTEAGVTIADLSAADPAGDVTADLRSGIPKTHFCTWLIRRPALLAVGGAREWFVTAEDLDLMFRLAEQGPVWHDPRVAYLYRLHDASIVHTQASVLREFYQRCAEDFARQRLAGGSDPLMAGRPPSPPIPGADDSAAKARDQAIELLVGTAWVLHAGGQWGAGLRKLGTALRLAPFSAVVWKQVVAMLVKSPPRDRTRH